MGGGARLFGALDVCRRENEGSRRDNVLRRRVALCGGGRVTYTVVRYARFDAHSPLLSCHTSAIHAKLIIAIIITHCSHYRARSRYYCY